MIWLACCSLGQDWRDVWIPAVSLEQVLSIHTALIHAAVWIKAGYVDSLTFVYE